MELIELNHALLGKPYSINLAHVISFCSHENGGTEIKVSTGEIHRATESYEEVRDMCGAKPA